MRRPFAAAPLPRPVRHLSALSAVTLVAACAAREPPLADTQALLSQVMESYRADLAGVGGAPPAGPRSADPALRPTAARVAPRTTGGAPGNIAPTPGEPPVERAAAPGREALAGLPRDAAALTGQTPETVLRVLGPPAFRRVEGPAEVWLYQGGGCHLDLVLYAEAGGPRVGWAAARAAGTGRVTETACLRAIATAPRQSPGV
ncbi:hypothetical protein [Roseomonas sp. BN140053]|uniref:hypothetical protein n=1 Tax=Roseomonas sp. BN140053 TaxID=3391898 RepID=UPI0039E8E928